MRIFVDTFELKLALEVESFERVDCVKKLIQEKEGTLRSKQTLAFKGGQLEDSKALADYDIQNDDTIHMFHHQHGMYNGDIIIKTFGEKSFSGITRLSDTIHKVKSQYEEEMGIPVNEQKLFFFDQELDDGDRTLEDYGLFEDAVLRLVRVRGHGYDAVDISAVQARRKAAFLKAKGIGNPSKIGSKRARKESSSATDDDVRHETKRLKQELVMERSTGASFLQSESGRHHILMLKRQAAKSAVDEFKVSAAFKETVMNHSVKVYDHIVKECQWLLSYSGRVPEDIIQLIDGVDSDQEERGRKVDRKNLMQELDVERSTGSFFLQSGVGRRHIATLQRQAAKSAVDEFKESALFEEMVRNRAMSIYDDVLKECQRLLRQSGRVPEDIIQLFDCPQDDLLLAKKWDF